MTQRAQRLVIFALFLGMGRLNAGELPPDQVEFFEKKIRPVLVNTCYECHSVERNKSKAGLSMDTKDGMLKGGNTGPAIVPGDVEKSLLLAAIRGDDPDSAMPPKGKKLTPEQIADFTAWVKMGAPDPRTGPPATTAIDALFKLGAVHWAYQPVKDPRPPDVENVEYIQNEIDRFVLANQERNGVYPAPKADKRTLIRRATFDLTGLPPTLEEVESFVSDPSPDAFAHLIDRLLASPHYGERWGRHWLDVARYSDSAGPSSGDKPYPYAYSYRDYVIKSFNEDKPYDRFVTEQLAADKLITPEDNRILAAQGFLTVGRRRDAIIDDGVYDDWIDVISRGLMGMTATCARCHDHKLEPIYARDYYALYGVLRSNAEPASLPELKPGPDTPEYKAFVQERDKLCKDYMTLMAKECEKTVDLCTARVGDYILAVIDGKFKVIRENNAVLTDVIKPRQLNEKLYDMFAERTKNWLAKPENKAVVGLLNDLSLLKDEERDPKFAEVLKKFIETPTTNARVIAVLKETQPKSLKELAPVYTRLFKEAHDACCKTHEAVRQTASIPKPEDPSLDVKPLESEVDVRSTTMWKRGLTDPVLDAIRVTIFTAEYAPLNINGTSQLFAEDARKAVDEAANKRQTLENTHPGAAPRAMTLNEAAVWNGHVYLRGNPATLGPPAPRKFFEIIAGPKAPLLSEKTSGRLELAQAIVAPTNPLTARVIVNRIWGWHFGQCIVRTPSDFGLRGEAPTNPELLDYLASRFVREGWSFKKLTRHIMLSRTYQQSCVGQGGITQTDPENKLWTRMAGRPLEFEAFRDAQLAITGRLVDKFGGRPVDLKSEDKTTLRRTVYGLVDRKTLPTLFRNFDFPDPNFSAPQRGRSALTPQALYLLNSGFIVENARTLANTVKAEADKSPADGVRRLYELILQRRPKEAEIERALAFLKAYPEKDTVRPEATDWMYGRGTFDVASGSLKNFTSLVQYTGKAWQMPDKAQGLALTAEGGEAGKGADADAIRRWTPPIDGQVEVTGELSRILKNGAAITARVVHNGKKVLGEWTAKDNDVPTAIKKLDLKKGDTLDFIVSGGKDPTTDHFGWAPTIIMLTAEMPGVPGMKRKWDAKTDFMDIRQMPKPLSAWEELSQVLLLSNEFMYLD